VRSKHLGGWECRPKLGIKKFFLTCSSHCIKFQENNTGLVSPSPSNPHMPLIRSWSRSRGTLRLSTQLHSVCSKVKTSRTSLLISASEVHLCECGLSTPHLVDYGKQETYACYPVVFRVARVNCYSKPSIDYLQANLYPEKDSERLISTS
jgi:hypothetical protein